MGPPPAMPSPAGRPSFGARGSMAPPPTAAAPRGPDVVMASPLRDALPPQQWRVQPSPACIGGEADEGAAAEGAARPVPIGTFEGIEA